MVLCEAIDVPKKISLSERMKSQPRLIQQQNQFFACTLSRWVELMLDTVEPDQKAKEPDESAAALIEWRANSAMPAILDTLSLIHI